MGLPEIIISFQQKAVTALQTSSRGMVAVILNDDTKEQFLTPYVREREIGAEDWTAENLKLLKLAFKGNPQKVLAVRALKTENTVNLEQTLNEIKAINIDYLVYPGFTAVQKETIMTFLTAIRKQGKKIKMVLAECAADSEYIVNFTTENVTVKWEDSDTTEEYTGAQYSVRIAGILAGLPLTQSCTYYALDEVVDAKLTSDPDAAVDTGQLIIIFDGEKYKIARGVTSLTTISKVKPEQLKKIKIVEGRDIILHDIYQTFEEDYVGKVVNSYDNKQLFVGAVNDYLKRIEGSILDPDAENYVEVSAELNKEYMESKKKDTADMTEQELKEANTDTFMLLDGSCKFLDAAEDLKLQMYM